MSQTGPSPWDVLLEDLSALGLRRKLRRMDRACGPYVEIHGRRLCSFASNNYLGLADHPHVVGAVKAAVDEFGWGAGASRLVCGHSLLHERLEQRLAAFKRTEAALVCPTGYQANLAAIRALAGPGDVVLIDKLNHASIIDAARGSGAVVRVFPHLDYGKLQRLLERTAGPRRPARRRIIVTDSVFSMDGDFAELAHLVELKQRYEAILVIDEAHATGVFGQHGRGLAEEMGVEERVDVVVGTLSKALGGIGGFIAARTEIIDWIVNTAGPFIYTTAIPPAACAAALAALDVVEREPQRRRRLLAHAERLQAALDDRPLKAEVDDVDGVLRPTNSSMHRNSQSAISLATGDPPVPGAPAGRRCQTPCSQIIPVIVGGADAAMNLSCELEEKGLLVPAIRPPTVPRGRARLRISLCSEHTDQDLSRLIDALHRRGGRTP